MQITKRKTQALLKLTSALSTATNEHPLKRMDVAPLLAKTIGVDFIGISFWNSTQNAYEDAYCFGRDERMSNQYESYFQFVDPISPLHQRKQKLASHIFESVDPGSLKKTEYFNDFLKPNGTTEGINLSLFNNSSGYYCDLRLWRGPADSLLSKHETYLLDLLKPYLESSISRYREHSLATDTVKRFDSNKLLLVEFTQREREIGQLVFTGHSDKEIARVLNISFWTVRTHVSNLLKKTSSKNRTQFSQRWLAYQAS